MVVEDILGCLYPVSLFMCKECCGPCVCSKQWTVLVSLGQFGTVSKCLENGGKVGFENYSVSRAETLTD